MATGSFLLMYVVGLLIGLTAGFFMHRSDYCITRMFRDAIMFGDTFLLRAIFLQVIITMILFEIVRRAGFLPLYPFPILSSPSLVNILGGILFGVGMVLAGGCVVGTLYKMGAGSRLSGVAFVGLILGNMIYAEMHPWWSTFAKATQFFKGNITLSQLFAVDPGLILVPFVAVAAIWIIKWRRQGSFTRQTAVEGYIQPWITGVVLAVLGLVSYLAVGMPLGITTTYAKVAAMLENLVAPGYIEASAFYNLMPLNVVHPDTNVLLQGGPGPGLDYIWIIQFPLIIGIIFGSAGSAIHLREFGNFRGGAPGRQLLMAFVGGLILSLASRMAPSCNIWHLMGGVPILAMQSILFVIGLIPGTWIGSKILVRVIKSSKHGE
ncbi:YeeE/YedE family protein [Thermodesulfobacteriota bacterium]